MSHGSLYDEKEKREGRERRKKQELKDNAETRSSQRER
jgi:hypothetical protein